MLSERAFALQDYLDCVEKPMDLSTVKKKLTLGQYTQLQDFIADMALIFNNSFCYNSKNSGVQYMRCSGRSCAERADSQTFLL